MYTSEKISNHLESVKFTGKGEGAGIECTFYVTPLSFDLCYEVDDVIAKHIFHRTADHSPVQELGRTNLNLGNLPIYNLEIFPHNVEGADGAGRMIAGCKVGAVYVDKLFADKPDWSLVWKVIVPLDKNSIELVMMYFKKTSFITLVKAQDTLVEESDGKPKPVVIDDATVECQQLMTCEVNNEERALYLGSDGKAWCGEHVHAAMPDVKVRKIKYAEGLA